MDTRTDDIHLPDSSAFAAILREIRAENPAWVSYDALEAAMVARGLDPYDYPDEYAWLVDQLEKAGISVGISSPEEEEPPSSFMADDFAAEVEKVLRDVRWAIAQRENQLLTAEEERRLLETYALGREAAARLAEEPKLPAEERAELEELNRRGEEALEMLLRYNQRLVAWMVHKHLPQARNLEFEDLFQEGMLGLLRALERFSLEQKRRLSTYATWWIRQAITRALADKNATIRFPVHIHDRLQKLKAVTRELTQTLNRSPTELELAVAMELITPEQAAASRHSPEVRHALEKIRKWQKLARTRTVSLEAPVGDDETSLLGEFIPADDPSPEDQAIANILAETLRDLIRTELTPRYQRVLIQRFGLDDEPERTLEEIGQQLGLTRERVRQLQQKALERLRQSRNARKLRWFWEE